jgi:hypothetical protein
VTRIVVAQGTGRWSHKELHKVKDLLYDHEPDPHYNGNGKPSWWTCHKCGGSLLLDGKAVPITVGLAPATSDAEPPLSAQP